MSKTTPSILVCALLAGGAMAQQAQAADATLARVAAPCRLQQLPALPEPITSFGACCAGGWLYVFGGHIGREHAHSRDNVTAAFWRLNLADGRSWQRLPDGPALQGTALVAGSDGGIYRIGGLAAHNPAGAEADLHSTASVARFDPTACRWAEATALPEPRSSHDAVVSGDRIVVAGGWQLAGSGDGQWQRSCWFADVRRQPLVWQPLPALDHDRRAAALATRSGQLLLAGGIGADGLLNTAVVLDADGDRWRTAPTLPGVGFGCTAIGSGDGYLATVADGRLLAWNGDADAWTPVAQLSLPRFFHRLVPTAAGDLLAVGGAGRGGHTRSIERITLATPSTPPAPVFDELVLPAPSRVRERQAVLLQDNVLWAFGGHRGTSDDRFAPNQFADDVWRIDLLAQTATLAAPLPYPVQSLAAVALGSGGDPVLLGGLGPANGDGEVRSLAHVLRVRGKRRIAERWATLREPRTQCQVVHHDGRLLVLGGTDFVPDAEGGQTRGDMQQVFVGDPAASPPDFAPAALRLPRPRRSFGAAVVGERLLLVGGLAEGFEHAGPADLHDFATGAWSTVATPVPWVSPQVAVIGERAYIACGGTMRGQRFTQDRALWSWSEREGFQQVLAELPFAVRHVHMLACRNRLLFFAANDGDDRIVIRMFTPDRAVLVPETAMHR